MVPVSGVTAMEGGMVTVVIGDRLPGGAGLVRHVLRWVERQKAVAHLLTVGQTSLLLSESS